MRKKNAFLIIDAQYDFCHPNGALFVPGAQEDMQRLAKLIIDQQDQIDHICVTLDAHPVNDISHPAFWQDKNGNYPPPFTHISLEDALNGKWTPRFFPKESIAYLQALESQGQFPHLIWPEHCLMGSQGAGLDSTLMEALKTWTRKGKYYQAVTKGTFPLTEHFGIFMANIAYPDRPETQLNQQLINTLASYEHVFLAGQAKSHCVATSLKQALDHAPDFAQKIIVIQDCMSDVPNMGHLGEPIYQQAKNVGVRFANAAELVLS